MGVPTTRTTRTARTSPVTRARGVPASTQALLYAITAGRCEFRGCNKPLFEHQLTLRDGNFAQVAHIYAFSKRGPRGNAPQRPKNVHTLANLVLLCSECHHQIDTEPDDFPVALLKDYKRDHEERIRLVTDLRAEMRTVVLQLKSKVGGDAVEIPLTDVSRAVTPRWPKDRQGVIIDLAKIDDTQPGFTTLAAEEIRRRVERLYEPGMDADQVRHISLFALAPIPLLVHLGTRLSNKIPVDLYQRHRDTKDWAWKVDGSIVEYEERIPRRGSDPSRVALVLSLSGVIDLARLPAAIDDTFTVVELTLKGIAPTPDFLRRREDLVAFGIAYRHVLARIVREHPGAKELHLFPAVPAPVAVACGYELLKKAQPLLVIYDYDRANGGFAESLRAG